MSNGNHSYADRIQGTNLGEELFETYCESKGFHLTRLGFDEHKVNIPNFFRLNQYIRNIPDYVDNTDNETFVVNVKGTANFKKKEVDMLPLFTEWFSTKKAPLVYAFCFEGQKPKLVYPEKIIELYKKSTDRKWSDGIVYRNLEL